MFLCTCAILNANHYKLLKSLKHIVFQPNDDENLSNSSSSSSHSLFKNEDVIDEIVDTYTKNLPKRESWHPSNHPSKKKRLNHKILTVNSINKLKSELVCIKHCTA